MSSKARRINWLAVALVASLGLNLAIAGAVAARWYVGQGPERLPRVAQSQLIPRSFFHDLETPRRAELLTAFRSHDKDIRAGRQAVKAALATLADALAAEPYDEARVAAAVAAFTSRSEALFTTGSAAALDLIGRLTAAERQAMARALRSPVPPKPAAAKPAASGG